nr:Ig-like domain-containing protein [Bacteroides sp. 214]
MGIVLSCASIGRPEGGPIDETPPRLIGSTPKLNATQSTRTKLRLDFDEYIKLEKPNEKVIISPPQVQQAEIRASGRSVLINLFDTLKSDRTYTIDFSDAIVDNNEGNPLNNFVFSFSTGDVIDTMAVSGTLLDAANLEPIKGMLIGLHSNLEDSAFTTIPLERVSRTDSRGRFTIQGIAPGSYRIFGLQDVDQNFFFSQKSEMIAFNDSIIIPHFEERTRQDTIRIDSVTIDTIISRQYTHYLPDDIILRAFKEEYGVQKFVKSERLTPNKFTLFFGAKADTLPTIKGINFDETDAFVIEKKITNDTINYWIKDSLVYKLDTLAMSMSYLYTDTLNQLVPRTDTLKITVRKSLNKDTEKEKEEDSSRRRRKKKGDDEDDTPKTVFLNMKANVPSSMDVFGHISISFEEPIREYDPAAFHLKMKVDSLWNDVAFNIEQDTANIKMYNVYPANEWKSQGEYEFSLDSIAFVGLYGLHTDKVKQAFKVKSIEEDYGAIFFNISGVKFEHAFVQLLDGQDKVVRTRPVVDNQADFYFLAPGKYCARLVVDKNKNGVWDTGNYEAGIQPEEVYYYWQVVELRVRQEFEQDWNLTDRTLDRQKPDEMKKQKPDEQKKRRTNTTNRNRNQGQNRNRNF